MTYTTFADADVSEAMWPLQLDEATAPRFERSADVTTDGPSQQEAAPRPVFDAEATLARVEGNRDLLRSMVGVLAMQWRRSLAEIAKAGQHHDGATLELTASKLQRTLGSVGAREASRVAQELEGRGRKSDFDDVDKTCIRLQAEIERLVNALKEFTQR